MKNNKKYILILSLIVIVFTIVIFGNNILKDTRASSETTSNIINMNGAKYITNLYNNNNKTVVSNNNINYNYASSVSLMNDNFGNIRYYGASPNNYIDIGDVYEEDVIITENDNYKENGFSSYKECVNYVDEGFKKEYETMKNIDCNSDYEKYNFSSAEECTNRKNEILINYGCSSFDDNCYNKIYEEMIKPEINDFCGLPSSTIPKGTPILYRIIGVFDGKLKVIRSESIGSYFWKVNDSSYNMWGYSDLMKLLNPGYENNTGLDSDDNDITVNNSLWWNNQSGTCYIGKNSYMTTCDFTSTGLSNNAKDIISEENWYAGGVRGRNFYANDSYQEEKNMLWTGRVGLLSLSDYLYATDFNKCDAGAVWWPLSSDYNSKVKSTFLDFNNSLCNNNNWTFNNNEWLITAYDDEEVWNITEEHNFTASPRPSYYSSLVHPVMYLVPDVNIIKGDGTSDNPYVIGNLYSATINYYYLEDGKETTKKIKDSDVVNNLENNYNEVFKVPKIEGCKASKEEVNITINNSNFVDNVYYSCDITENVKTGNIITIIISLLGISILIVIMYYYLKKKKDK